LIKRPEQYRFYF